MPALQQTSIPVTASKSESNTPTIPEATPPASIPNEKLSKPVQEPPAPKPIHKPQEPEQKQGFFSRLFKSKEQPVESKVAKGT